MKYYSLEHEYKKEVVGPYPQSEGMADHYHYKREDSIWNLNYERHFPPNLDAIQLAKGAKLTDLLSVVVVSPLAGKIVSEEFKLVLSKFNLPVHAFFKARVLDSSKKEVTEKQYYLFRVLEYQNKFIDFDKSEFYIHRVAQGEIGSIEIRKAEELEFSPTERGLRPTEVIKPRFVSLFADISFDIFSFRRFAGYFISERLKSAIEKNNLSGMRFEPADFILQD